MTTKKILVLLALALGACRAQNRSSIEILGRAASTSATECKYTAGSDFQLGGGVLDVGPQYSNFLTYELPLYVNNELADPTVTANSALASSKAWRPDVAKVRINPSNFVKDLRPSPALIPFEAENTIPLDGHTIEVNSKSVELVSAVSHELGLAIQAAGSGGTLVLGITLQGHTLDGEFLETGEWYYRVEVCTGCLAAPATCPATKPALQFSCGGPGQDSAPICVAAP